MRVLLVSHYALPHVGGVEVAVDEEIRALTAAGHAVTLVTSDALGRAQTPDYGPDVRVVRVPAWYVLERRAQLAYPLFSPRLLSVLWREAASCDVVHAHGFIYLCTSAALLVARLRGRASAMTDHGGIQIYHHRVATFCAGVAAQTLGRVNTLAANKVVAYNSRVLEEMERLSLHRRSAQFLPYPFDTGAGYAPAEPERRADLRRRFGWTRPVALFVGRLIEDKGVLLVRDARSDEFDVVICGAGDPAILGWLPDGVRLLEARPRVELIDLYHAADVLVLPSARESFPFVVREALSCGLPVVLADQHGYEPYKELRGFVTCVRSVEGVRAAVEAVVREPEHHRPDLAQIATFFPSSQEWVRRMYEDLVTASRSSPRAVSPDTEGTA